MIKDLLKKFAKEGIEAPAKILAATGAAGDSTIKSYLKGKYADLKRGHILHRRGYGKYYDSALEIAKKGKLNPDRHRVSGSKY